MVGFLGTASQRRAARGAARARGIRAGRIRPTRGDVGAGATPAVRAAAVASLSQKTAKQSALNSLNDLIRRTPQGQEKFRLIQERDRISGIAATGFTPSVISSVQETISREQARARGEIAPVPPVSRVRGITSSELKRIKAEARQERIQRVKTKIERRPTITTGGVPLTILGIPGKLEVIKRKPTEFEKAKQRGIVESLKLVGALGLETGKEVAIAIGEAPVKVVSDFFIRIKDRPIGKIKTGEVEVTRGVAISGKTLFEKKKEIETKEPVLFPTISEDVGRIARGVGSGLQFTFETAPREIKKAGIFVTSKKGREQIKKAATIVKEEFIKSPKETTIAAGTLATIGALKIVKSTTEAFVKEPLFITGEAIVFGKTLGVIGIPFKAAKVKLREFKFERGIKKLEKSVTEPGLKFDKRPTFVPTGKIILEIKPKGITKKIIEVEERRPGFLVFGEAGEIVGRQLQLKPRFRPEFEAQAEFISPALGIERVIKLQDDFLGKFVKRPLTPLQQIAAREPPRVIKVVQERQKTLIEFKFKPLRPQKIPFIIEFKEPPRFAGEVFQIGGLIPPQIIKPEIPFEKFGGKFFERKPKPIIEKLEAPKIPTRQRIRFKSLLISKTEISPLSIIGLKKLQEEITIPEIKPILGVGITPIERLRAFEKTEPIEKVIPIISSRVAVEPRVRAKVRADIELKPITIPKIEIRPITRPKPELKPIKKEPIKETPKQKPRIKFDFDRKRRIKKPSFTTEVREGERKGDKFIRVRKRTLPRQRAINLGARIADNTTARTFQIKRKGTTTLQDTNRFPLKDKFRGRIGKSKLPPKVFVEKSRFAIDSPGERLGIPFNPIRIPRLREAAARKKARKVSRTIPKTLTTGRGRTMRFL